MPNLRLCLIGPMVGRNPGYVTTQVQILFDLFLRDRYEVFGASSFSNRYSRFADMTRLLVQKGGKADVIILDVFGGPSFVVEETMSFIARRLRKPLVMVLRGGAMPQFMAKFPRWTKRVLRRAQRLVTPSEFLAKALKPYGFSAQIIPNVIDIEAYPYRQRSAIRPSLFWMRAFHPVWNPLMALRVLSRLRQKYPQAALVMGGQDKGMLEEVRKTAANMKLQDAIKFAGFLEMSQKTHEGHQADIFINTNRIDNMPVAVVEACAMGLPVVSTNVGGIPYLLTDEQTGLLVPDNDDAAMAEAILRLLQDSQLVSRLSENGRKLAEHSSWEAVRPQWESVFKEVSKGVA